jgi:hypothetical protein
VVVRGKTAERPGLLRSYTSAGLFSRGTSRYQTQHGQGWGRAAGFGEKGRHATLLTPVVQSAGLLTRRQMVEGAGAHDPPPTTTARAWVVTLVSRDRPLRSVALQGEAATHPGQLFTCCAIHRK